MTVAAAFSFYRIAYLVFESVLQVVFISLSGYWAAASGMLPRGSQKSLSRLNVDLFTPCLIFSKLGKSLSLAKILELFVIPVFFLLTTGISYFSGKITAYFLQLDTDETNFVIGNSVFGNSNSLPVSLTLSLAYTLPNLTWDDIPNDNRDNVASRGLLYLLIFQQFGQMLRWSWGYNTLLRWSGESYENMPQSQIQVLEEEGRLLTPTDASVDPASPFSSTSNSSFDDTEKTFVQKVGASLKRGITKFASYLNPPLYSIFFAVIVAVIPSLQNELFYKGGFLNNTFGEATTQLGNVSIPMILLVLGSNIYPSEESFKKTKKHNRMVFGSIFGRMVLPSLILLPIITIAVKYINTSILDDPIFLVVGFILTVSPPAIQLTQITQLNEFFEAEMASILSWSYVVLTLPVSIIVISSAIYVLQWANPPELIN